MLLLALLSLVFSGWMLFTLHQSVRAEKLAGWRDRLSVAWIGAGAGAGVLMALVSLAGELLP